MIGYFIVFSNYWWNNVILKKIMFVFKGSNCNIMWMVFYGGWVVNKLYIRFLLNFRYDLLSYLLIFNE